MAPSSITQPVDSPCTFPAENVAALYERRPAVADRRYSLALVPCHLSLSRGPGRGFTLLELLTVVALIGILAGLFLGVGHRANEAGRIARTKAELATFAAALDRYRATFGDYPQTDDPVRLLQSLIGRRDPLNGMVATRSFLATGRFETAESRDAFADATAVLVDPWGRAYRYAYKTQLPWSNASYVLCSSGPDGRDSGNLIAGGFPDPVPVENADNIHANR